MNFTFHRNCENAGKISCVRFHFGPILWNLKFIFFGPHKKFFLALLEITNYIYSSLKKVKINIICFKLLWYKVFVHWKLKILNFLKGTILGHVHTNLHIFKNRISQSKGNLRKTWQTINELTSCPTNKTTVKAGADPGFWNGGWIFVII